MVDQPYCEIEDKGNLVYENNTRDCVSNTKESSENLIVGEKSRQLNAQSSYFKKTNRTETDNSRIIVVVACEDPANDCSNVMFKISCVYIEGIDNKEGD